MQRIGLFEKVSFEQFVKDIEGCGEALKSAGADFESAYKAVEVPKRATTGSAGYDFHLPFDLELEVGKSVRIPTAIRSKIDEGWMLMLAPRSGLGYKYRIQLDNTVGIIDSDYYFSDNEGHIQIKLTNDGKEGKSLSLKAGDRFAQGIFIPYGITSDDEAEGVRNGGFGSTR